jgi:hypothetical protein
MMATTAANLCNFEYDKNGGTYIRDRSRSSFGVSLGNKKIKRAEQYSEQGFQVFEKK